MVYRDTTITCSQLVYVAVINDIGDYDERTYSFVAMSTDLYMLKATHTNPYYRFMSLPDYMALPFRNTQED